MARVGCTKIFPFNAGKKSTCHTLFLQSSALLSSFLAFRLPLHDAIFTIFPRSSLPSAVSGMNCFEFCFIFRPTIGSGDPLKSSCKPEVTTPLLERHDEQSSSLGFALFRIEQLFDLLSSLFVSASLTPALCDLERTEPLEA